MGNKRLRWILTEIAQNYSRVPIIGKDLRNRRLGVSPKYTEVADRCMHRRIHKSGLWPRSCNRQMTNDNVSNASSLIKPKRENRSVQTFDDRHHFGS
jgi:hypothetical protein